MILVITFGAIGLKEIFLIFIGYLIVRGIIGFTRTRKTVLNMKDQMEKEMKNAQRAANQKPEGEITIDKSVKDKNKKIDDKSGDYVDFEEIE